MKAGSHNQRIEVRLSEPVDLGLSLGPFRRNGDDLIDRFDGATYVRTLPIQGRVVGVVVHTESSSATVRFTASVEDGIRVDEEAAATALRGQFVTHAHALARLEQSDPIIASLARHGRGLAVVLQPDLLHALVRCISAQQVNLRWATATRARLVSLFGTAHAIGPHTAYSIDGERLGAADPSELRRLQFTQRKSEYLVSTARALASGSVSIDELRGMGDEQVVERLTSLRGIGSWSADWILIRTLGRPRVAADDLGVQRAVGYIYGCESRPTSDEVRRLTAHWGSAAGVCQQLVLERFVQCGSVR